MQVLMKSFIHFWSYPLIMVVYFLRNEEYQNLEGGEKNFFLHKKLEREGKYSEV